MHIAMGNCKNLRDFNFANLHGFAKFAKITFCKNLQVYGSMLDKACTSTNVHNTTDDNYTFGQIMQFCLRKRVGKCYHTILDSRQNTFSTLTKPSTSVPILTPY